MQRIRFAELSARGHHFLIHMECLVPRKVMLRRLIATNTYTPMMNISKNAWLQKMLFVSQFLPDLGAACFHLWAVNQPLHLQHRHQRLLQLLHLHVHRCIMSAYVKMQRTQLLGQYVRVFRMRPLRVQPVRSKAMWQPPIVTNISLLMMNMSASVLLRKMRNAKRFTLDLGDVCFHPLAVNQPPHQHQHLLQQHLLQCLWILCRLRRLHPQILLQIEGSFP